MQDVSTCAHSTSSKTDQKPRLMWDRVWMVVGKGMRLYFAVGGMYRVVSTEFVNGMRLARHPSGRARKLFYATRAYIDRYENRAKYELLSVHGTAAAAIRACERDYAAGDDSMVPSWPRSFS